MDTPRAPQDRPAFPEDAVVWLAGPTPRTVVVLGSGEIAAALEAAGHEVTCPPGRPDRLPQPDRSSTWSSPPAACRATCRTSPVSSVPAASSP